MEPGEDRAEVAQGCSFTIILITMCMYLGSLIALSVVPTSRADYLAGQRDNDPTALTDHPYYGMFVFDIIIVWVEGFGCISGILVAEDVLPASLASLRCQVFVVAVAERMFDGHKWGFRPGR